MSRTWWGIPVIQYRRLRQEDHKFEADPGYVMSWRLVLFVYFKATTSALRTTNFKRARLFCSACYLHPGLSRVPTFAHPPFICLQHFVFKLYSGVKRRGDAAAAESKAAVVCPLSLVSRIDEDSFVSQRYE